MLYSKKRLLHEISSIRSGYSIRGKVLGNPSGAISLIQMKDVQPSIAIDWSNLTRINPVSTREPDYVRQGDVIFCGRGTRIFSVPVLESPVRTVAAGHFFIITPDDGEVLPAFLSWYINSLEAQRYFWRNAAGSGIMNVRQRALAELDVPLPAIDKQLTFVKMIDAVDAERRLSKTLSEKRQTLLETVLATSTEEP